MPSFDITSEFNQQEVTNAIDQMNKYFTKCSLEEKLEILNEGYAGAPPGKSSKGYVPPGMEGSYQKGCQSLFCFTL